MSFAIVPVAVYLISYGAFFVQHGFAIGDFIRLQSAMLHYQQTHLAVQPENSSPWSWPLLLHPVRYLNEVHDGSRSVVVALGNPAVWWGFLVSVAVRTGADRPPPSWQHAVTFGGYAVMFLPWFAVGRTQFIWYMLPAVPFMCLCVASTLRGLPARVPRNAAVAFGAATFIAAVAFMPLWTGWPVADAWVRALAWLPDWPI